MKSSEARLKRALEEVDRFNSEDPRRDTVDGVDYPRELLYSQRLTHWVLKLDPHASDALRIAARGQHIGRWTLPRGEYPMGRSGYLRWRNALKSFHTNKVEDLLREVGYGPEFIERVSALMLKRNIKEDADTQTLEDALCLVFFESQFAELMSKTPKDKMKSLLRKTWNKMSEDGRDAALKMKRPLQQMRFIDAALAQPSQEES